MVEPASNENYLFGSVPKIVGTVYSLGSLPTPRQGSEPSCPWFSRLGKSPYLHSPERLLLVGLWFGLVFFKADKFRKWFYFLDPCWAFAPDAKMISVGRPDTISLTEELFCLDIEILQAGNMLEGETWHAIITACSIRFYALGAWNYFYAWVILRYNLDLYSSHSI